MQTLKKEMRRKYQLQIEKEIRFFRFVGDEVAYKKLGIQVDKNVVSEYFGIVICSFTAMLINLCKNRNIFGFSLKPSCHIPLMLTYSAIDWFFHRHL